MSELTLESLARRLEEFVRRLDERSDTPRRSPLTEAGPVCDFLCPGWRSARSLKKRTAGAENPIRH